MKLPGSSTFDDRLSAFSHSASIAAGSRLLRWGRLLAVLLIAYGAGCLVWPPLGLYSVALLLGYSAALTPTALATYFPARRRALATTFILALIPATLLAWGISQAIHLWLGWAIVSGVVLAGFVQLIAAPRKDHPARGLFMGFALSACGLVMVIYQPLIQAHIHNVAAALIISVGALLLLWPQPHKAANGS